MTDQAAYDLVIIGGGIAGSALAATMAKAGATVLVLEASATFPDRVRGEWIAPWGVSETKRLGLYELLRSAGGHHIGQHLTYDETRDPADAEAHMLPLSIFAPDVPGPLAIGHPHHCQTLIDEAVRAGAVVVREAMVTDLAFGPSPRATYADNGGEHTARARLVIGADGRTSAVREKAGIALGQDKPHHMFAGLLVEGVPDWDPDIQAIGTEADFAFLTFPQGSGRARVYGSFSLEDRRRFSAPEGPRAFLDAFRMQCAPANEAIAVGRPAGPLLSYFNNDAWTDQPFAEGVVLVGDAAGWNDPIIGQGLSITYRDVRIVTDILKATPDWRPEAFAPYAEERRERMRRLRFAAALSSVIDAEFGDAARGRRRSYFERSALDPSLGARGIAVMAGPDAAPPEIFTDDHWRLVTDEPMDAFPMFAAGR